MDDNQNEKDGLLNHNGAKADEGPLIDLESASTSSAEVTGSASASDVPMPPREAELPSSPSHKAEEMVPSMGALSPIKAEGEYMVEGFLPVAELVEKGEQVSQDSRSMDSTLQSSPSYTEAKNNPKAKLDTTADESGLVVGDEADFREGCDVPSHYMRRLAIVLLVVVLISAIVIIVIALPGKKKNGSQEGPSPTPGSASPTPSPSAGPTVSPDAPSAAPVPEVSPTAAPSTELTASPMQSPTKNELFDLFAQWSGADTLNDKSTPQSKAYEWMSQFDQLGVQEEEAMKQRYSIATVFFGVSENDDEMLPEEYQSKHECEWPTIQCNETTQELRAINLSPSVQYRSLAGTLPGNELGFLSTLTSIDISENNLRGQIPEELYSLTQLTGLYLHHNLLSGTISPSIGKLMNIEDIYLNHNNLVGSIPREIRSVDTIRPLRKLYLNSNQLTGRIPEGLRFRELFLMDLSFNQMTGPIPEDFGLTAVWLRHLYLEHNQFSGQIPESIATVGNSRLIDLIVNDNQFTGSVPTQWVKGNTFMLTLRVHNNRFTEELDKNVCKMDVWMGGEVVEISADCDICSCDNYCNRCFIDGVRQGGDPLFNDNLN